MLSLKQILENSAELQRLKDRVHTTVLARGNSPEERAEWERACSEFHQQFDRLAFPGGFATLRRVRENDPAALEAAISFLAADPYHFRSGYLKEYLWRWLPHCNLSPSALSHLESTSLRYLERRISREFWSMCKAMARLGRSDFWCKVSLHAQATGTPEALRALCLLTHRADVHAGARLRRTVHRSWLKRKYGEG